MKIKNIRYWALATVLALGVTSCEDFLDRPSEDSYNISNFYQNDEQCFQGVNPLYSSPWNDFFRGFLNVGDVLSGNLHMGNNQFLTFTVDGGNTILRSMSQSLWSVNAYCNTIYQRLQTATASQKAINTSMGECLTWKAMTYFYLVRIFGAVPIVHDNSEDINSGNYVSNYKVEVPDVYEYIIMTLEKAISLLPEKNDAGRIDQYTAKGLLAKVYLTKSGYGMSGTRNEDDLAKAASYAKDVIEHSRRNLLPVYSDIFRLENNQNEECLLSWHWYGTREPWTAGNSLQNELGVKGFDDWNSWGSWTCPSVDLQDAFEENALNPVRNNRDARRKATMMMCGDVYDYFWQDRGGFDYIKHMFSDAGLGKYEAGTGANCVKHLYGDSYDHEKGLGYAPQEQANGLSTHILRLADIYLVYAEAVIGNGTSTTDASAIDAFYKVRHRSVPTYKVPTSITWEDVWKERRLELAMEGDRWYDYVRLAYYNPQLAINELKNQRRDTYDGLADLYKTFNETGTFTVDPTKAHYKENPTIPNVTEKSFTIPFPSEDVVFNGNLMKDPIHVDVRSEFSY